MFQCFSSCEVHQHDACTATGVSLPGALVTQPANMADPARAGRPGSVAAAGREPALLVRRLGFRFQRSAELDEHGLLLADEACVRQGAARVWREASPGVLRDQAVAAWLQVLGRADVHPVEHQLQRMRAAEPAARAPGREGRVWVGQGLGCRAWGGMGAWVGLGLGFRVGWALAQRDAAASVPPW